MSLQEFALTATIAIIIGLNGRRSVFSAQFLLLSRSCSLSQQQTSYIRHHWGSHESLVKQRRHRSAVRIPIVIGTLPKTETLHPPVDLPATPRKRIVHIDTKRNRSDGERRKGRQRTRIHRTKKNVRNAK